MLNKGQFISCGAEQSPRLILDQPGCEVITLEGAGCLCLLCSYEYRRVFFLFFFSREAPFKKVKDDVSKALQSGEPSLPTPPVAFTAPDFDYWDSFASDIYAPQHFFFHPTTFLLLNRGALNPEAT